MRLTVLFFFLLCSVGLRAQTSSYALVGAKIYASPVSEPIEEGTVVVRAGRIVAVGPSKEIHLPANIHTIDCHGEILTSAFWNCHVHFMEQKWMNAATAPAAELEEQLASMITSRGFVHVFDIAEIEFPHLLALRRRINNGELKGPVIYCVGVPFVPPNGSPIYIEPLKLPEIGDPKEAALHVKHQIDSGANGIKIWSASPIYHQIVYMPLNTAKAAVTEAHKLGKPVFAHPTDNKGVAIAVEAGVDILAHTSPDGNSHDQNSNWSDTLVRKMLAHHMALIPTLKLWTWELTRSGLPLDSAIQSPLVTVALSQLAQYEKAGGQILFGTDVGYVRDYSTELEFRLMAAAGLDYEQILASLTTSPAERFGQSAHTGRIVPGIDADLVLLDGDPAKDITAFSKVVKTISKGKIIYSASN